MTIRWSTASFLLGAACTALSLTLGVMIGPWSIEHRDVTQPSVAEEDPAVDVPRISAAPRIGPPSPTGAAIQSAQNFQASGSVLQVPVQGVRPEDLMDTYSDARSQGRRHDAIDIPAPRGTPVVSVAASTVMKLFQSERGGTTLYALAPDQRTIYYYAHLDRYAEDMTEGKELRAGEVIGYVGDTGNAVRGNYHLHFGISTTRDPAKYWGGTPLNPYPLLRGRVDLP